MRSVVPYVWVVLGLSGCVNPYDREGSKPFECEDGADNDGDGYFDCDDNGCWNSPDCGGGPDDTDTGNDTDTGGDTDTSDTNVDTDCTSFACDYTSVHVVMTHDVDAPPDLCSEFLPICDCVLTFEGDGDIVEAEGWRVTFLGTWELTGTTAVSTAEQGACDAYAAGVWLPPPSDPVAYHSIQFRNSGAELDIWVAHQSASGYDPIKTGGALAAGQYPIWDMRRPWTAQSTTTTHTEDVPWMFPDTAYPMTTTVTATFTLDKN